MNLPVNDGRLCPIDYHYSPADIAAAPPTAADTLYIIGGLYGNAAALAAIEQLAAAERGPVTLVFNGDFNWFNRDAQTFEQINRRVLRHSALRGNVETEIARQDFTGGCGCGYPASVPDQVVGWSNDIIASLRDTATKFPRLQRQLLDLPRFLRFRVGDASVAAIHGDCRSLAGWTLSRENLRAGVSAQVLRDLLACDATVIACTHTCEPYATRLSAQNRQMAVINNGAAGMPNLRHTGHGIITRIGVEPAPKSLYRCDISGVSVQALAVDYDRCAFNDYFLSQWPAGSAAHHSYYGRIESGTNLTRQCVIGEGFGDEPD